MQRVCIIGIYPFASFFTTGPSPSTSLLFIRRRSLFYSLPRHRQIVFIYEPTVWTPGPGPVHLGPFPKTRPARQLRYRRLQRARTLGRTTRRTLWVIRVLRRLGSHYMTDAKSATGTARSLRRQRRQQLADANRHSSSSTREPLMPCYIVVSPTEHQNPQYI